ncbi:MAG: Zn-ribbon domain-containing OB-fold protein [Mycobacteriales bacterium]
MAQQLPAVDYLVLGDRPHLQAWTCDACGAAYFDRRNACARCFAGAFSRTPLATEGTVRALTRVERGAKQPFTSVVVDLAGVAVKANLRGIEDPERVTAETRVQLTTFVVGTDDDGVEAVAFGFEAAGGDA